MDDLPKISLIMPSFNQAHYLEAAIESVLTQKYENLEFIVMDGGSQDGTVDILKKFERSLSYWESEKDRGQSHAINKGFARSTGEIIGWLCSDDLLLPGALETVAKYFRSGDVDVISGACEMRYERSPSSTRVIPCRRQLLDLLPCLNPIWQPSCFFRRDVIRRPNLVMENLHFSMDCELWCYLKFRGARWKIVDDALGVFRVTGENKSHTGGEKTMREIERIYQEYVKERVPLVYLERKAWLPFQQAYRRNPRSIFGIGNGVMAKAVGFVLRAFYGRRKVSALEGQYAMYAIEQEMSA